MGVTQCMFPPFFLDYLLITGVLMTLERLRSGLYLSALSLVLCSIFFPFFLCGTHVQSQFCCNSKAFSYLIQLICVALIWPDPVLRDELIRPRDITLHLQSAVYNRIGSLCQGEMQVTTLGTGTPVGIKMYAWTASYQNETVEVIERKLQEIGSLISGSFPIVIRCLERFLPRG